jgi:L-alanine-DL-glutamate epimerase-like enolase superfamily enzyme
MHLTWSVERFALRVPFRISRASISDKELVVVALEHDGLVGYGEAAATAYYSQEMPAIEATLSSIATLLAEWVTPFDLLCGLDGLNKRFADQPVTLAALDAAAHDWIGKRLDLPVWRFLGTGPTRHRSTALTLGIAEPDEAAAAARLAVERGAEILKLKVGLPSLDQDRDLVAAVRAAAPAATLYLDANGGWPADAAAARIAALLPFQPALIEQPIPPGQVDALRRLHATTPVPIIADEDACTARDIPRLWGAVDGVNVKLSKCGGLRQAVAMIHTARAAGLRVMLGCVVSSSLGLAPSVHLAPLADYLDLDGHLLLGEDPWAGLGDGVALSSSTLPGLGVVRRLTNSNSKGEDACVDSLAL